MRNQGFLSDDEGEVEELEEVEEVSDLLLGSLPLFSENTEDPESIEAMRNTDEKYGR